VGEEAAEVPLLNGAYTHCFQKGPLSEAHEYWISTGLHVVFAERGKLIVDNILFFIVFFFLRFEFSTGTSLSF
jgi:hypothetical protein